MYSRYLLGFVQKNIAMTEPHSGLSFLVGKSQRHGLLSVQVPLQTKILVLLNVLNVNF